MKHVWLLGFILGFLLGLPHVLAHWYAMSRSARYARDFEHHGQAGLTCHWLEIITCPCLLPLGVGFWCLEHYRRA